MAGREPAGRRAVQICSAGNDAAWTAAFATLDGKKVQGRPLAYARRAARRRAARLPAAVRAAARGAARRRPPPAGLLSIGESEGFAAAGGVVGFVREGTQLRSTSTAMPRRAQLHQPLRELLKVARGVIDGAGARP